MRPPTELTLTLDEIDDVLYLVRTNDGAELQEVLQQLGSKYQYPTPSILGACIDPDTGNTVLHFCSANGFADLLQNLFRLLAVDGGESASSRQLVNAQNKEGNTPLHWAAYNGHLAVVKALLQAGADMWIKNAAGHLAMFEAERAERSEVVQYLLAVGGREVERTGREGEVAEGEEIAIQDADISRATSNGSSSSDGRGDVAVATTSGG